MKRLSATQITIVTTLVAGLIVLASVAGGEVTKLDSIEFAQTPIATTYTINPSGVGPVPGIHDSTSPRAW